MPSADFEFFQAPDSCSSTQRLSCSDVWANSLRQNPPQVKDVLLSCLSERRSKHDRQEYERVCTLGKDASFSHEWAWQTNSITFSHLHRYSSYAKPPSISFFSICLFAQSPHKALSGTPIWLSSSTACWISKPSSKEGCIHAAVYYCYACWVNSSATEAVITAIVIIGSSKRRFSLR